MGTIMLDTEEDLALFIEMRKREKDRSKLLLPNSDELGQPLESQPGGSPNFEMLRPTVRKTVVDDLLNSDSEKSDYDWLLTPPGTPLFPNLEESYRFPLVHGTPNGHTTTLKSRLANPAGPPKNRPNTRQLAPSSNIKPSISKMQRPSTSGGSSVTSSRPATPTGRSSLSTAPKLPRSFTPISRPTLPPKSVVAQPWSSMPVRSPTPISRSSIPPADKPESRSVTPNRRPPSPSILQAGASPPSRCSIPKPCIPTASITKASVTKLGPSTKSIPATNSTTRSGSISGSNIRLGLANSIPKPVPLTNSASKSCLPVSKISGPLRGTSPTIKSRLWKPSEMPGYSFDVPPNLITTLPERSSPARGRSGTPSTRSSSFETVPNARPRRQSCSPSRGRALKGNAVSGSSIPASIRPGAKGSDSESPVVIGTKMVERAVNLRRLAPPKQDYQPSSNTSSVKSSLSPDSTGFGRTLSKKSLDMAMRHMDIRRCIPNKLRPLMKSIPASSLYSIRPGSVRGGAASVSGSPLATSSNASSEQSVGNNSAFYSDGNEVEHDCYSEKGWRTPPSFFVAR